MRVEHIVLVFRTQVNSEYIEPFDRVLHKFLKYNIHVYQKGSNASVHIKRGSSTRVLCINKASLARPWTPRTETSTHAAIEFGTQRRLGPCPVRVVAAPHWGLGACGVV